MVILNGHCAASEYWSAIDPALHPLPHRAELLRPPWSLRGMECFPPAVQLDRTPKLSFGAWPVPGVAAAAAPGKDLRRATSCRLPGSRRNRPGRPKPAHNQDPSRSPAESTRCSCSRSLRYAGSTSSGPIDTDDKPRGCGGGVCQLLLVFSSQPGAQLDATRTCKD
jgi:hypothetical protein